MMLCFNDYVGGERELTEVLTEALKGGYDVEVIINGESYKVRL